MPSPCKRSRTRLLHGVGLAAVMSVMVGGCSRDAGSAAGSAAALEAAVQKSMRLMSEADWETAYHEVLTRNQRAACSLAEYAERENTGLAMIRDSLGEGEISIMELNAEVVGNVGLVTGTAVYTTELSGQVGVEGQGTDADLRARRNLGTATAENPDYWIFEDGGWRWVQRRPDSPCYNEADMELGPSRRRLGRTARIDPCVPGLAAAGRASQSRLRS